MRHKIAILAGVAALATFGAACGGGDDDGGGDATGTGGGSTSGSTSKNPITVWSLENQADRVQALEAIAKDFTTASGIEVKIVGVDPNQLTTLITSSSAADKLPDVINLNLSLLPSFAAEGIVDTGAANEVVDELGRDTFAEKALDLVEVDGEPAGVPSDGWGQLLLYRKDLFDKAALAAPDTYEAITAAAKKLDKPGMAGIVLSTTPGDAFTEESFEHVALADNCQLTTDGEVSLDTPECAEAFGFYGDLAKNYSVSGVQDVDTTRATYFAGKAAMIIWSPFILDEMAGLRKDALPSCPECKADPAFLAKNSGIVTAIAGPKGDASQYGELVTWAISDTAEKDESKAFVKYMLGDGYLPWLEIAPEGKFPLRQGTADEPSKFVDGWGSLQAGVDTKAPLSDFYSKATLEALAKGPDNFERWAFEDGQGELEGAVRGELLIAKSVADAAGGESGEAVAKSAQSSVSELQESLP